MTDLEASSGGNWAELKQQVQADPLALMLMREPSTVLGGHHYLLRDVMLDLYAKRLTQVVISMPPRHSKSYTISETFPAWWLGNRPTDQVIAVSYGAQLASQFGGKVRATMSTPWFESVFGNGACPSGKSTSGSAFATNAGGFYKATGVGGSLTGFGSHLQIIDDPIKSAETADSPRYTDMLEKFFGETLSTRMMPGGVQVLMMTRWRENDLAGHVIRNFGWDFINIKAIADSSDGSIDRLGRADGEALWPAFFDLGRLQSIERILGRDSFSALYQGCPVSASGGTLRPEDVRLVDSEFDLAQILPDSSMDSVSGDFWSWDTGVTGSDTADWTVGQHWLLMRSGKLVCSEYVRERVDFDELWQLISSTSAGKLALIEHTHTGLNLKSHLAKVAPDLQVRLWQPRRYGSKSSRLQFSLPHWRNGDVHFVRQGGKEDWATCLDELYKAGKTANDDFLDAAVQAVLYAKENAKQLLELAIASKQRSISQSLGPTFTTATRRSMRRRFG
jgi:phage terminase large subunit-like protein